MQVMCPDPPVAWILEAALGVSLPAFAAICVLVIVTPFEARQAVLSIPYQQFTLTEVVWLLAAIAFVASHVIRRQPPVWRTPVTASWITWMAVMAVAAMAADTERANAIRTTGRFVVFGLTALMVANAVTTVRRMVILLATAAITGMVVALIAVFEVWQVPSIVSGLGTFRDGVRVVGGHVRASSTLQYPTITAMYLELVFCGALGVLLWITERRGWRHAVVVLAGLVTIIAGLALTLTRAAMLAAMCGVVLAAWWRYRHRGPDRGFVYVAACAFCLATAPTVLGSAELARARWTTEGRQGWYRASFEAPGEVTGRPGELITVPVTAANHGIISWPANAAPPFHISYHWVEADTTKVVVFDGERTPLPSDVQPGASVVVQATVRLPPRPGRYRIAWDVVQEGRLWFVGEPGALTTFTPATITGPPLTAGSVPPSSRRSPLVLAASLPTPGRTVLWPSALRMFAEHPLLGVGPDNFRFHYAGYLGLAESDTRVHSNNLYLEVLTGSGIVGAAACVWFLWRVVRMVAAQRRRLSGQAAAVYTGVASAGVAYLAHGVLDSFMTFTPTAFASALILGLAIAPSLWPRPAQEASS
jgi:hypothetical protein